MITVLEFRVVGRKIHCVRFRAQSSKIGQGKVVASFRADVDEIPDGVISALSSKEVEQLYAWFEAWRGLRERTLLSDARLAAGGLDARGLGACGWRPRWVDSRAGGRLVDGADPGR